MNMHTKPTRLPTAQGALAAPHLPECPPVTLDGVPLAAIRDHMTGLEAHTPTEEAIASLYEDWARDRNATAPLQRVRAILDAARELPRGELRIQAMNTIVRGFGQAKALATFLDMLRDAATRAGSLEETLSRHSRHESKHSLYGWAGQTKLVGSSPSATAATLGAEPGVQEMLGHIPATMWGLNMHIWQPNPSAKGFDAGIQLDPGVIVEPPHSHPFDFVSMVSIGEMRQSIYVQRDATAHPQQEAKGRYDGVVLRHVHGVWPPHDDEAPAMVATRDEGVTISAGQSYYLPCNVIHDVEINGVIARTRPAITLFLRSEAVVRPHAYMSPTMVRYHKDNPDLERTGRPLSDEDWHAKLSAVSDYLRGPSDLVLDDIVGQKSTYAFFHT